MSFVEIDKKVVALYKAGDVKKTREAAKELHKLHSEGKLPPSHFDRVFNYLSYTFNDDYYDILVKGISLYLPEIVASLVVAGKKVVEIVSDEKQVTLPGSNPFRCLLSDVPKAKRKLCVNTTLDSENEIVWVTQLMRMTDVSAKKYIFSSQEIKDFCCKYYAPLSGITNFEVIPGSSSLSVAADAKTPVTEENKTPAVNTTTQKSFMYMGNDQADIEFIISKVKELDAPVFIYTDMKIGIADPSVKAKVFTLPTSLAKNGFARHDILLLPARGELSIYPQLVDAALVNTCLPLLADTIPLNSTVPKFSAETMVQVANKYLKEGFTFHPSPTLTEGIKAILNEIDK